MGVINTVTLIGRVVRDIELKASKSGTQVAPFTLAVDGRNKEAPTDFIDCVAFGGAADVLVKYAKKGREIGISGSLRVTTYEVNDGKRKKTEVVVDQIRLLGGQSKNSAEDNKTATIPDEVDLNEIPF